MSQAFLAYVTWDRVVPWKVLSLPKGRSLDFVPVGYGAGKQRDVLKQVRPDDTLWIVTIPTPRATGGPSRRDYPPTLVARIRVARVLPGRDCAPKDRSSGIDELRAIWCSIAESNRSDSRFFGLNDAAGAFARLGLFPPKRGNGLEQDSGTLRENIGRLLPAIRRIPGGETAATRAFGECMRQGVSDTVFMSYAHADGEAEALDLAKDLLREGLSPWLDSLMIPLYDVRMEDTGHPHRLQRLLRLGIRTCAFSLCIVGDNYRRKRGPDGICWTQREWEQIQERRKHDSRFRCACVMWSDRRICAADCCFTLPDQELARTIAQWWKQNAGPPPLTSRLLG